jgi:hypothetical protein
MDRGASVDPSKLMEFKKNITELYTKEIGTADKNDVKNP